MLRIHFTGEDLAKVHLAAQPDPLWETVLTLFRLRGKGTPLALDRWRRQALSRSQRSTLTALTALTPGGYFPDFLTPSEGRLGLDAGLDAVLSTGKGRLRSEIGRIETPRQHLPQPIRLLAEGDVEALAWLGQTLKQHHDAVVAPYWDEVRAHFDADRAKRSQAWLAGGCEGLLNSYRPLMRWRYPVLEADFPVEQDLHLQGRGLVLVPSYFSVRWPDTLFDGELSPVLVYPVEHDLRRPGPAGTDHPGDPDDVPPESLAALIGVTRAWVLGAIEDGCTTTALARRVGVNASSISQHTTVLREARLIRTTRVGKSVIHTLTPLGRSLLPNA